MATQGGSSPTSSTSSPDPTSSGPPSSAATTDRTSIVSAGPSSGAPAEGNLFDALLLVILILSILLVLILFGTISAITLILLAGVWGVDAHWKRSIRINNTTMFADLSFTCLIYVVGKGIDLIRGATQNNDPDYGGKLLVTIFVLMLIWSLNLTICRGVQEDKFSSLKISSSSEKRLLISAIIAFVTTFAVLILQYYKKI